MVIDENYHGSELDIVTSISAVTQRVSVVRCTSKVIRSTYRCSTAVTRSGGPPPVGGFDMKIIRGG